MAEENLSDAFSKALSSGSVDDVQRVLKAYKKTNKLSKATKKLLTGWRGDSGATVLHVSSEAGHLDLTTFLLSKCAENVNIVDDYKNSCLILAAMKHRLEVCRLLLNQRKLDVNIANIDETSALHYLVRHQPSETSEWTILKDLWRTLVKRKVNVNKLTLRGESALHQAVRQNCREAITFLCVDGKADVNVVNVRGEAALHYAVMVGSTDLVEQLLEFGAKKTVKSEAGQTPWDMAREMGRTDLADVIQHFDKNMISSPDDNARIKTLIKYKKLAIAINHSAFLATSLGEVLDKTDYDPFAKALIHISLLAGTTVPLTRGLIEAEFIHNHHDPTSILRGNCVASKVMGMFSRKIGQSYLSECLGAIVADLALNERNNFEIDPAKMYDIEDKEAEIEKNFKQLMSKAGMLLDRIVSDAMVSKMPREIRAVAGFVAEYARIYAPTREVALVGGFIMLRLFNPSLVTPESFGMLPLGKTPTSKCRRNLVIITKVLQNLSNNIPFGVKEPHMDICNSFIAENTERMNDYLRRVASDPMKTPATIEWEDCRELRTRLVDPTLLELKQLVLTHRLLNTNNEAISSKVAAAVESGSLTEADASLINGTLKYLSDWEPMNTTSSAVPTSVGVKKGKKSK